VEQTPAHLCLETVTARRRCPPNLRTGFDFEAMTGDKDDAGRLARWLLQLGKLRRFDLAERLRVEAGDEEAESDVVRSRGKQTAAARRAGDGAKLKIGGYIVK
jgi:hypothetical protein